MSTVQNNHRIDYIELGATDIGRIKQFYSRVFNWKFTDYGPDYTSFEDGRMTGGFARGAAPGSSPLVVLYATDLEATKAAVAANGGRIHRDIFSFPGGRRFHFADPSGNELAVWGNEK